MYLSQSDFSVPSSLNNHLNNTVINVVDSFYMLVMMLGDVESDARMRGVITGLKAGVVKEMGSRTN